MESIYKEFARRVVRVNKANGWEPSSLETLPGKMMFVITEMAEAWDELGGPEFAYELADIAIRILDSLQSIWGNGWCVREHGVFSFLHPGHSLPSNLWVILRPICSAVECWRHGKETDTMVCLERALLACRQVALCYNINLETKISEKIEKNAQRGHLHGKKRKDG
jgi:NTP pyrophosphatase (non-canonical NTP hydrolase)